MDQVFFTLGDTAITLGRLLAMGLSALVVLLLAYFVFVRWLPSFFDREESDKLYRKRTRRLVFFTLLLLLLYVLLTQLGLDYTLYDAPEPEASKKVKTFFSIDLTVLSLIKALFVLQLAHVINWFMSEIIVGNYQRRKESGNLGFRPDLDRRRAASVLRPVIYVLALMFIIQDIGLNYEFFQYDVTANGKTEPISFRFSFILSAILIIVLARFLIWFVTRIFLHSYYQQKQVNPGSRYAINRLLAYFIYVIAILYALQALGIDLTLLWGGAAALLVGIGLGLQQTFNDLICGIILLFERTVEVGDVVDVNSNVGTVKKIGLRTSLVETRDFITVIVPNSKLVGENVTNWSHYEKKARFHINVGVAYGSDTQLVRELLEQVAENHRKILKSPAPFARFIDFGNSSLDFQIHFWSREFMRIEDVKSDLRFAIDRAFREHKITIPFPQRDVWMRQAEKPNAEEDYPSPPEAM